MSRVAVACGGRSLERGVSIHSGRRSARALEQLGHDVTVVDVGAAFIDDLKAVAPDYVFVALHGAGGEDGTVQDLLEILEVPYTGSDALASALCLDKHLFKTICGLHGVPTPTWHSFTRQAFADYGAAEALHAIMSQFDQGLVVKPARQGSSMGIGIVRDEAELRGAVLAAMSYDERVLLEQLIPGKELAVTVLGPASDPEVLPVVELVFEDPIYSFEAHYEIGRASVQAAELPEAVDARVREVAARAYSASGCRDFARVDIRLDGDAPWVLEINTIPGLTETGPTPLAAEFAGMSFGSLIKKVCSRVEAG
jgi:D-alanine-D-alanine ligase